MPTNASAQIDAQSQTQSHAESQVAVAELEIVQAGPASEFPTDTSLGDRIDAVLNPINGAVFATLFFDVSFGTLRGPAVDDDGQPKFERVAVLRELDAAVEAIKVDDAGNVLTDDDGEPVTATLPAGAKLHTLGDDGKPAYGDGAQEIEGPQLPFLVVWLAFGAVFFTVYHKFINLRGFGHAIAIVRGKWEAGDDTGDITPFRALTSALSATVGLGNIAGVAIAMVIGGPGALLWMMVLGFFGMASKFHETTLAQLFRIRNHDGSMSGGPMFFLSAGIKQQYPTLAPLGKALAVVFAIFLMAASLGGGNMFQANQSYEAFFSQFVQPVLSAETINDADALATARGGVSVGFGLLMAAMVAVVVIGGIGRIGAATSIIVPVMAVIYVAACLFIIGNNFDRLPDLIGLVFREAWAPEAGLGGVLGAMMVGFQRAAFSSEAGIGSSAVAHAAAKTDEPIREGLVASLEPFVDTIVICFMTGMVVLITGSYLEEIEGGAAVTLSAFASNETLEAWYFPKILTISIMLFAFSTMISWCYYGERAWGYLFGIKSVIVFRLVFVVCVFAGSVASLGAVIDSADAMLLACALPNILGGILLAPLVKRRLTVYWAKYRAGQLVPGEPVMPLHDERGADI